jgi:hypothetical protein
VRRKAPEQSGAFVFTRCHQFTPGGNCQIYLMCILFFQTNDVAKIFAMADEARDLVRTLLATFNR